MQLRTALQQGLELLREGQVGAPELTAEVLLCHALRRERIYLFSHPEHELSDIEWLHYGRYLHERLKGKPTQYITHVQEFWGREFHVEPGVLIPRPETEHVVEQALAVWGGSPEPRGASRPRSEPARSPEQAREALDIHRSLTVAAAPERVAAQPQRSRDREGAVDDADALRILDIGTGSGILAITLALETNATTYATDLSEPALNVARRNARNLNASCEFLTCDLGSAFASSSFELIVSNPPYIESADIASLQREVRDWEPHLALDCGTQGLDIYARLVPEALRGLRPNGSLILEIGSGQAETVSALFDARWRTPTVVNDLAGLARVVVAQRA